MGRLRPGGLKLTSPSGGVLMNATDITVRGTSHVEIKAAGRLDLTGSDVKINDGTP
jgi:hypothetical protein